MLRIYHYIIAENIFGVQIIEFHYIIYIILYNIYNIST